MQVDPNTLSARERYRLMISCVVPRPIAWVATCSAAGERNLAPFSFFGGFCTAPPTIGISTGMRGAEPKDTLRNIRDTREFVVAIPTASTVEAMVATSADYEAGTSEFEACGLSTAAATLVSAPLVAEAAVNLECRLTQSIPLGERTVLMLGEIVRFHCDDAVLTPEGVVDPRKLQAIGRLGGQWYCATAPGLFELPRPPKPV
jgi:flavin reductase (DIM6/NTAB) family NADH-FMN oxidoreductase RutF